MQSTKIINTDKNKERSKQFFLIVFRILVMQTFPQPVRWSNGNAFVSGAGGLRLKYRAGQIKHSVANGSSPCKIAVLLGRNDAEISPEIRLHASA